MPRDLPSLDLLPGFEAAARHLSFTRAATELFVTQSAISRQIKALEDELGVVLFERRNRSLVLTTEGEVFLRSTQALLAQLRESVAELRKRSQPRALTVSTTVNFASLWLVPRLRRWRALHPEIDVHIAADDRIVDLARDHIDLAVRFCPARDAPPGALRLEDEVVFPVCSPKLLKRKRPPLKSPRDLTQHVLLHLESAGARLPWLDWAQWLAAQKLPQLQSAGSVRFSHYDQLIRAAIEGEGVALGRTPMLHAQLKSGELVAPFSRRTQTGRQYYLIVAPGAEARPEVQALMTWMLDEVQAD